MVNQKRLFTPVEWRVGVRAGLPEKAFLNWEISVPSVVSLDNDTKPSSSDLPTPENPNNPSSRALQSSAHTGGKPIDVMTPLFFF